ncbi:unnamed protein product, partial [Cylicocyclus nassatus]
PLLLSVVRQGVYWHSCRVYCICLDSEGSRHVIWFKASQRTLGLLKDHISNGRPSVSFSVMSLTLV